MNELTPYILLHEIGYFYYLINKQLFGLIGDMYFDNNIEDLIGKSINE